MAITTGNLTRVSNSLKAFLSLSHLRQNGLQLFREEQRIASGRQLLSAGEDPVSAEQITRLSQSLVSQSQVLSNLRHADNWLSAADSAITEVSDLLIEAARVASEQAGSLQSAEERAAQAVVVDGIIDQLLNVGNRRFQGLFLFAGRDVKTAPLNTTLGRVTWTGDARERQTLVDSAMAGGYSISLADLYGLRQSVTGGYAKYNQVLLTDETRLGELDGALGVGIRAGSIAVTEQGVGTFTVDLSAAETLADVVARFNAEAAAAGTGLTLEINPADKTTLRVSSAAGHGITVEEVAGGMTATDLGLRGSTPAGAAPTRLVGSNLNRRLTATTALSDWQAGGVVLTHGVQISNGSRTAVVSFAGAATVQDVLNRLNNSGTGIRAAINEDGDGIVVENLLSGTPLVIGENGGNDAELLGIRTLDASVSLSRLNGYRGIHPIAGQNDLRITDAGGVTFEVNLDGCRTVGEVMAAIQSAATAAGASLTVGTSTAGAGLRLTGAGGGLISVERVGLSPVAAELGLEGTGTIPGVLEGANVGQFYQTGVFSALYRLRDALLADNSSEITEAGAQINALQTHVAAEAGRVGARARSMRDRLQQTEDAVTATTVLLSELQDVDFTEAVTRFQQAQTALQASLLASSQSLNMSLLDFLR